MLATRPSLGAGLPLLAGFGHVWSASTQGLIRFSLAGSAQKFLGKPVKDIALSAHAVVVLLENSSQLLTLDPTTLQVTHQWVLPGAGLSITATGDVAYVVQGSAPEGITRINLTSGVSSTRALPADATPASDRSIAFGDGSVWVATSSLIYQLNPLGLTTTRSIASTIPISSVWFGDNAVWGSSENSGVGVFRLDPKNGAITVTRGTDAIQIAFAPRRVWLAAAVGATALDPATGHLVGTIPTSDVPDDGTAGIAVVGSNLWVANYNQVTIQFLQIEAD